MDAFKTHRGIVSTLDTANVDTDQIIAKQFLKSIKRTGFGDPLFYDWRFNEDGSIKTDFSLNKPEFKGASILVARNNFGCGSSREHAVWAVIQYGYKVVIAPSKGSGNNFIPAFADIFRNNSVKNGLLTVQLKEEEVNRIFEIVKEQPGVEATVDLENQKIIFSDGKESTFVFEIDTSTKKRLSEGLDDIGISLKEEDKIAAFEEKHNPQICLTHRS